jgi:hypothetical protein
MEYSGSIRAIEWAVKRIGKNSLVGFYPGVGDQYQTEQSVKASKSDDRLSGGRIENVHDAISRVSSPSHS